MPVKQVPRLLFSSWSSWEQKYSIQMPPFKNQFAYDAGGVYPDLTEFAPFEVMHHSGAYSAGFKFPPENISRFHDALRLADVLIDETYPHGQTLATIADAYALPGQTVGQTFLAGGDDPAVGSTGWALVSHGVGEKLFTVSSEGELIPQLAASVEQVGDEWVLTLASGRKFSDGSDVTAADVVGFVGWATSGLSRMAWTNA